MERIPEPELMLDPAQARAYAEADFAEPHDRFVSLLGEKLRPRPGRGRALDLGCGPGDVAFRFARAFPGWVVDAIDASPAMLELARAAAAAAGLAERVRFHELHLPAASLPHPPYDLVFSNSLLHHLEDPQTLWSTLTGLLRVPADLFVMDLRRPADRATAEALVERHAAGAPAVLRTDFLNSFLASYRPAEVQSQLSRAGLGHLAVERISDRHMIVWGSAQSSRSP